MVDFQRQYKRAIEFDIDKLIKVDDDDRLDPVLVEHCAALSVDQTPIQELTKAIKGRYELTLKSHSLQLTGIELASLEKLHKIASLTSRVRR